jgi:hypothetical protein
MEQPQPADIFKALEGLEITQVPDGFVIFDAASEKVHYLNPTAAVIFELSDGERSLDQIAAFMKEAYTLAEAPIQETLSCAQNLVELGLLGPCQK